MLESKHPSAYLQADYERSLNVLSKLPGSSQSCLVGESDGGRWIVKLQGRVQLSNLLANELLGFHLCRALELPVPDYRKIQLSQVFFEENRTWLSGPMGLERPQPGLHFASEYMPKSDRPVLETLPRSLEAYVSNSDDCLGMFLFDVWASHRDRRQGLYFDAHDGRIHVVFIDNGHLFGGPYWFNHSYLRHVGAVQRVAIRAIDAGHSIHEWITKMQSVLPPAFESAVSELPAPWHGGDVVKLKRVYLTRLFHLEKLALEAVAFVRGQNRTEYVCSQASSNSTLSIVA